MERRLLRHAEETLPALYPSIRPESFTGQTRADAFCKACGREHGNRLEGEGPVEVECIKSHKGG
ncbi:GNAT family N-acetyltransferase [Streptomyces poriticola]|uniref:GNAT family N-acetyltransferase n=1 Tax=Streptomyces poriticola TaxID=3120506 RepID=UPI002FCDFEDE